MLYEVITVFSGFDLLDDGRLLFNNHKSNLVVIQLTADNASDAPETADDKMIF